MPRHFKAMVVRHGPATYWLFLNKISGIPQLNHMKPRDIFKLAVRLLGLVFLYHGLISLPTLFTGIFGSALNAFVIFLMVAWPLLVAYILLRHAAWFANYFYPESED